MFVIAQVQEIRNNLERLLGRVRVTDGDNNMPAMDAPERAGWMRQKQNAPDAQGMLNPSVSITWTGGSPTGIEMTAGGVTYSRTLGWSGGTLVSVSEWTHGE